MLSYYWRLLKTASVGHSWSVAEKVAGLISILGMPVSGLLSLRDPDKIVSQLGWQVSLAVFVGLFMLRLVGAPYWMHQEDEAKRQAERAEEGKRRAELEATLAAERARWEASLDARNRREERASCLADLLGTGHWLQLQNVDNSDRMKLWLEKYQEWIERVDSEVGRKFSAAHAASLKALEPVIDRQRRAFDGRHQDAVAQILAIMRGLREMLEALPDD